ncbi:Crp/Fnr family transcriptional regulator [Hydrogenophaga sp.]|uniref:Crp/Fnr family transcriptional regulator n=1 Tax=Hydrogenophaga sp. TaxID=1904254 RepID=UPI0025BA64BE|nr:Crp/Fnr family transcriptional regulator [Hydrogenophaga sp.]MBT9466578.1 Crp/Fnr family transcriptional regulator [Hydrogenophaga sp.]
MNLPAGHEVHAPGTATAHVYFPTTALVALMQPMPGGGDVSVALVGNDGMLGLAAFMGDFFESGRAVVLHPGAAWTLPVSALTAHGPDSVRVTQAVLGYLQALTDQMSQTALCQRTHSVEQRLCRWLLMAFNRLPDDALAIDLSDLTAQLDAPLDALAGAAEQLVRLGALACEPGRLRLLDRAVLQAQACDCHALSQSKRGM